MVFHSFKTPVAGPGLYPNDSVTLDPNFCPKLITVNMVCILKKYLDNIGQGQWKRLALNLECSEQLKKKSKS